MTINNGSVYHDPDFNVGESTRLFDPRKGDLTISCDSNAFGDYSYKSTSTIDDNDSIDGDFLSNKSHASRYSFVATLIEKVSPDNGSTLLLTVFSLLPILQGSAVLGVPYAFIVGGKAILPAILLISLLAMICTSLLVDSLYEISPRSLRRKRVYNGYGDLALACWGKLGSLVVKIMMFIYFAMNNVVNIVLLFKCLDNLMAHHNFPLTTNQLGCLSMLVFLPPMFFMKKISSLAYLGLIATFAVIVASLTSIVVFVQEFGQWHENLAQIQMIDWNQFPVGIGIIMYTLIAAPSLPDIEGTMRDRTKLPTALYVSFGTSSIFKSVYGFIAVLAFGFSTKQLIATNVSEESVPCRYIISIMLIVYAFCNSTFFFYLILQDIERILIRNVSDSIADGRKFHIVWVLFSRPLVLVILVAISLIMPFFALVSGVVGAVCGSFLAFISPVMFHLKLKWAQLSLTRRTCEVILLIISVLLGSITSYSSINKLVTSILNHHE